MQSKTILAIAAFTALHTLAKAQDKSTEKDVLTIYKGAHSYKEVSVAGKTTEIYVDDKRVADNEASHYDSLIQVMRTDVDVDNRNRVREDEQEDRDQEQAERNQRQAEREQEQAERQQEQAERNQERAERQQEQAQRDQERAQERTERAQEQRERDAARQEQDRAQADQERIQARSERAQAENEREQAKIDRIQAKFDREQAKEERAMLRNLIQFLVDKHIVADRDHLTNLVLTDSVLFVNGAKQQAEIHQTLKEQFARWAQCGLSYGDSQAPGTSMFFSRRYYSGCCE